MFVINPPHTLAGQLQAVLPWLVDVLGQYDGAHLRPGSARRLSRPARAEVRALSGAR